MNREIKEEETNQKICWTNWGYYKNFPDRHTQVWAWPPHRKRYVINPGDSLTFEKINLSPHYVKKTMHQGTYYYKYVRLPDSRYGRVKITNKLKDKFMLSEYAFPDTKDYCDKLWEKTIEPDGTTVMTRVSAAQEPWSPIPYRDTLNKRELKLDPIPFLDNTPVCGRTSWFASISKPKYKYKQNGTFTALIEITRETGPNGTIKINVFPSSEFVRHLGEQFIGYMRLEEVFRVITLNVLEEGFVLSRQKLTFKTGYNKCLVSLCK